MSRWVRTGGRVALSFVSLTALALAAGCLNRPIDRLEPKTTKGVFETLTSGRVNKIDLLLAIDNSTSMADKQLILGDAVPQLVDRLVNPLCIDFSVEDPAPFASIPQPTDPADECPTITKPNGAFVKTQRQFEPVKDIHVGIISSSLGDLGTGACGTSGFVNDKGHLLSRTLPAVEGGPVGKAPTHENNGFLFWDPDAQAGGLDDTAVFRSTLESMVIGVDQTGCGYEMQLESIYRFLVDPAPYDHLEREGKANVKKGVDQDLLDQRAAFLRPDSLVAIIMLSDENDCSVVATGQSHKVLDGSLPRGSSMCDDNPEDPCCYSCDAAEVPDGCEPDPICDAVGPESRPEYDGRNLRCWDQQRRMGTDQLYPIDRYLAAFTEQRIDPERLDLRPKQGEEGIANPLLDGRPAGQVYFAGIVGVPWQAIARKNAAGEPDLQQGYMTTAQLSDAGLFEALAGHPERYVPPTDPFMIESVDPRGGTSEILGLSPGSTNPINGGDQGVPGEADDWNLQPACTFAVPDGNGGTAQALARPGLRQLALIERMGEQAIAASVCPATLTADPNALDYGYNPAVGAIIDVLKDDLAGQECLPFSMKTETGLVDCLVIETRTADDCSCDVAGRSEPLPEHGVAVSTVLDSEYYNPDENCLCEVDQLMGDEMHSCQYDSDAELIESANGWCYIDGSVFPTVGNPNLIKCGGHDKAIIRAVGEVKPKGDSTLHIWCTGE